MKLSELYFISEYGNPKNCWLSRYKDDSDTNYPAVPADESNATSAMIAAFLDQECENDNRHDMVGIYARLLWIFDEEFDASEYDKKRLMVAILENGGLCDLA